MPGAARRGGRPRDGLPTSRRPRAAIVLASTITPGPPRAKFHAERDILIPPTCEWPADGPRPATSAAKPIRGELIGFANERVIDLWAALRHLGAGYGASVTATVASLQIPPPLRENAVHVATPFATVTR
jgi:hypothetical protein